MAVRPLTSLRAMLFQLAVRALAIRMRVPWRFVRVTTQNAGHAMTVGGRIAAGSRQFGQRRRGGFARRHSELQRPASPARRLPLADDVERAVEIALPAGMPLDLSAGCFGNAAGSDKDDRVNVHVVLAGDGPANRLKDFAELALLVPLDLGHNHQLLAAVLFQAQTRRRNRPSAADGSEIRSTRCLAGTSSRRGG